MKFKVSRWLRSIPSSWCLQSVLQGVKEDIFCSWLDSIVLFTIRALDNCWNILICPVILKYSKPLNSESKISLTIQFENIFSGQPRRDNRFLIDGSNDGGSHDDSSGNGRWRRRSRNDDHQSFGRRIASARRQIVFRRRSRKHSKDPERVSRRVDAHQVDTGSHWRQRHPSFGKVRR